MNMAEFVDYKKDGIWEHFLRKKTVIRPSVNCARPSWRRLAVRRKGCTNAWSAFTASTQWNESALMTHWVTPCIPGIPGIPGNDIFPFPIPGNEKSLTGMNTLVVARRSRLIRQISEIQYFPIWQLSCYIITSSLCVLSLHRWRSIKIYNVTRILLPSLTTEIHYTQLSLDFEAVAYSCESKYYYFDISAVSDAEARKRILQVCDGGTHL